VIRNNMQRAMQNDAAVFRTGETLAKASRRSATSTPASPTCKVSDRSLVWNSDLIETLELQNLLGRP
jgi:succinate dehydrogenase / fumarate reductase flavoprotein subunit